MPRVAKIVIVRKVEDHGKADNLRVVWTSYGPVIVTKDIDKGTPVLFFPKNTTPPDWLTNALDIRRYLKHGSVQEIALRGVRSVGIMVAVSKVKEAAEKMGWKFDVRDNDGYKRAIAACVGDLATMVRPARPKKIVWNKFKLMMNDAGEGEED